MGELGPAFWRVGPGWEITLAVGSMDEGKPPLCQPRILNVGWNVAIIFARNGIPALARLAPEAL